MKTTTAARREKANDEARKAVENLAEDTRPRDHLLRLGQATVEEEMEIFSGLSEGTVLHPRGKADSKEEDGYIKIQGLALEPTGKKWQKSGSERSKTISAARKAKARANKAVASLLKDLQVVASVEAKPHHDRVPLARKGQRRI